MASIYKEVVIEVRPDEVWAALRDWGALHRRLAPGFVTDCRLDGEDRIVTFAGGLVVREVLVALDDERRRLVWTVVDGPYSHHNGDDCTAIGVDATLASAVHGGEPDLPVGAVPISPALDLAHRTLLARARRGDDEHQLYERALRLITSGAAEREPRSGGVGKPGRRGRPSRAGRSGPGGAGRTS